MPLTENQIRQIIREELSHLIKSDRFTFEKLIQILDGRNIQVGLATGTKIGTAIDQKLGFWNKVPVVQPTSASQAAVSGTADSTYSANEVTLINDIVTLLNQIRSDLVNIGIIKGS